MKVVPDVETKVINPAGWDELKVSAPTVAVDEVPVTCGKAVETAFATLLKATTPFCKTENRSVIEFAITCDLKERSDT